MEKDKNDLKKHSIFKAFLIEIRDRWFSSRQRILKTVGVFLIPFLYGFVCIAAFWNPLGNIGSAPIAIASLDQKQLLVEDLDAPEQIGDFTVDGTQSILGIPEDWSADGSTWSPLLNTDLTMNGYENLATDGNHPSIKYIRTINQGVMNYSHTVPNEVGQTLNGGHESISLMDQFMGRWQNGGLANGGLTYNPSSNSFAIENVGFPITNIKYHNVQENTDFPNWANDATSLARFDVSNKQWNITNNNDYAQVTVPDDLTYILINYLDASITEKKNPQIYLDKLKDEPLNFYVTYEKSFLSAKLIDEMGSSLTAIANKSIPVMAGVIFQGIIEKIAQQIALPAYNSSDLRWTGGYSWKLPDTITTPVTGTITFNDHYYRSKDDSSAVGSIEETVHYDYQPGVWYTLPNEEYREALKLSVDTSYQDLYDLLNQKALDGTSYLIPTIEGISNNMSADQGWVWNYIGDGQSANEMNASHSLLHNIMKISKTLSAIPAFNNAMATLINFAINTKIDNVLSQFGVPPQYTIFDINVEGSDVSKILSNDQFLSSFLSQDARYMFAALNQPEVSFTGLMPGNKIEFARVLSLMGCSLITLPSIYAQFNIYGPYNTSHSYFNDDINGLIIDLNPQTATSVFIANGTRPNTNYCAQSYSDGGIASLTITDNIKITANSIIGLATSAYGYVDVDNYVSFITIGSSLNFYGMGLGEYFVCIGLLVGTLAQIVIYDKKKRVKKVNSRQWYLSKSLMMICTSVIQSTILAVSICAIGWYAIGASFILQWLFMIFAGLIFASTIQSIWFCFRERSFGLFVIMIFLVLNVACGWGTFPAFMQFQAFNWISIFLPFTYMMHIQGAIVYGISTGTHVMFNVVYILQNIATLLIYPAVFIPLGLFMSKYRERELYYGSAKGKKIASACKHLGKTEWLKPNGKVDWKALPHEEIPEIKLKLVQLYPYEKFIERFKSETLIKDAVEFDDN